MRFESFAHVSISDEVLAHIWEGEPGNPNKGGHRFGLGRNGKTEFPEHWDIDYVFYAIRRTLDEPQAIRWDKFRPTCSRVVAGVFVRVRFKAVRGQWEVLTAFPMCGDGVYLNIWGRRVEIPLDSRSLEE